CPRPASTRSSSCRAWTRMPSSPASDLMPLRTSWFAASPKPRPITSRPPWTPRVPRSVFVFVACLLPAGDRAEKPVSTGAARCEWQAMAGRSGQLHTGHCLVRLRDGQVSQRAAASFVTTVYFGTPTAADLDGYLDSGEPLAVAGGFPPRGR